MKPTTAIVQQAEQTEQQLIEMAQNAIAAEFWTVGYAASEWCENYARGRSENDFAELIGSNKQSVNLKRRVHQRFRNLSTLLTNLRFTHYVQALDFEHEPEHWLEEASENKWTVKEMVAAYQDYYTPDDETEDEPATNTTVSSFFNETVEASAGGTNPSPFESSTESATGPEQTTPPDSPSIVKDKLEHDIPSKLMEAWDRRHELNSTGKVLDKVKRDLLSLCEKPGCEFVDSQEVERTVKHLKDEIVRSAYYATCPSCNGDGCDRCKGHGYFPEKYKNHLQTEVAK